MKLPNPKDMNSDRFLKEAFDKKYHARWHKNALIRRNIYLWLFIVSVLCVFYTAITTQMTLCILSLFLATISLVVMTKYDTQLYFLNILKLRDEKKYDEPDHT